jgi:hypothetical protein
LLNRRAMRAGGLSGNGRCKHIPKVSAQQSSRQIAKFNAVAKLTQPRNGIKSKLARQFPDQKDWERCDDLDPHRADFHKQKNELLHSQKQWRPKGVDGGAIEIQTSPEAALACSIHLRPTPAKPISPSSRRAGAHTGLNYLRDNK